MTPKKNTGICGRPDRYDSLGLSYAIEKNNISWDELNMIVMIVESIPPVRGYIFSFAKELIYDHEGLQAHRGRNVYDDAFSAAAKVMNTAYVDGVGSKSNADISALLEPSDTWSKAHTKSAWHDYCNRKKRRYLPKELIERMKNEEYERPIDMIYRIAMAERNNTGEITDTRSLFKVK